MPIAVSLVTAEERSLPSTLDVTGTLMADAQTDIASEIEQRVVEILVERGPGLSAQAKWWRAWMPRTPQNQLQEAEAAEAQIRERLGMVNGQPFDALKTPEVQQARATMDRPRRTTSGLLSSSRKVRSLAPKHGPPPRRTT